LRMETAKVSRKYQLVIPKKVREALEIQENDLLLFEVEENAVRMRKFDELLEKHLGSVKLDTEFKKLRKEFNRRMAEEGVE
jgi:AbrB family looped-hinge helix DNA binding protein